MPVEVGKAVPDFTLVSDLGENVSLSAYQGQKKVVLAFFPLAFTGGWAHELTSFRSDHRKFEEQNAQVLGISVDSRFALHQFSLSLGRLPFPLLADFHPIGKVALSYGIYNEENGNNRRAVFIVDKGGVLRWSKVYSGGLPDNNELLEVLKQIPA